MDAIFNYDNAFSRNIGWVTKDELYRLKNATIAIAGLGGAGSEHLITLARMGFEHFHLADFDEYEIHNFNRQAAAFLDTVGQPKVEASLALARKINPNIKAKVFGSGVNKDNIDDFLDGVDLYVDGIDFFALDARLMVYQACFEKHIPNLLAAPLGMGAGLVTFLPGKMNYEAYYRFNDKTTDNEKFLQLLIGLTPALLQKGYLVDESTADFIQRKGPSTPMAIKLCSGMLVSNVVKIILGRGKVVSAPFTQQFDAYKNKYVISWLPFGNRGLLQRVKFNIAKGILIKE